MNQTKESLSARENSIVSALADPSMLTTAQLRREIENLEKLFTQRLNSLETAVSVAHEDLVRVPTAVDKAISQLREVTNERFNTVQESNGVIMEKLASVQTQFKERDTRVEQTARDTKVAVDAALQAAEKAVGKQNEASSLSIAKSEAATTKQIDQQGQLITTQTSGINSQILDLKERLTRIEGAGIGAEHAQNQRHTQSEGSRSLVGMVVGLLVGATGVIFGIIGLITHFSQKGL